MSNPLNAKYFADQAEQVTAEIVENVQIARDTFRLRFRAPEMARRSLPGQFFMLRIAGLQDPLIGRALALYDIVNDSNGEPDTLDVVYIVKGKFTTKLATMPSGQVEVWGPLGNGFVLPDVQRLIMVAGGIGQTPFLSVAREALHNRTYGVPSRTAPSIPNVVLCYGARNAEYFAGLDDFRNVGVDLRLATDDGSLGKHGLVTDLLDEVLDEPAESTQIVCCGPEPMMAAVAELAQRRSVPCQVSLETPMACGIGICFTCVAEIRCGEGEWDYKRTCVEGPVFDANQIAWEAMR